MPAVPQPQHAANATGQAWGVHLRCAALALFALLPPLAHAQATFTPPPCLPKTVLTPGATGGPLLLGQQPGGTWRGWHCPAARKVYVHVTLNPYFLNIGALQEVMVTALAAPDQLAWLGRTLQERTQAPSSSEAATFAAIYAAGVAAVRATVPTAPVAPAWRVKANASSTSDPPTRPAYPLVNGVRGLTSNGRAIVGQPCDLTKPSLAATGGEQWASFGPDFVAGTVALCEQAP